MIEEISIPFSCKNDPVKDSIRFLDPSYDSVSPQWVQRSEDEYEDELVMFNNRLDIVTKIINLAKHNM